MNTVKLFNGRKVKAQSQSYVVQQWNGGKWQNIAVYSPFEFEDAEKFMNEQQGEARIIQIF